jgi:hypothetical protein
MATRTAVVAGTATAVSGRVAHRQAGKYAAEDAQQQQQYAPPPPAPTYAPPPPAAPPEDDSMAKLQQLGQLHTQGVLSDEEFAAAKAKVLGI